LISGLLVFFHTSNVFHYIWIVDGIHLLSGILTLAAILSLLKALSSGHARWFLASLVFSVLALLTREDSLVVFPLLLWFGIAFIRTKDGARAPGLRKLPLVMYAALMLAALACYWYWRGVVVPRAPMLSMDPGGFVWAVTRTVQNAGQFQDLIRPWRIYEILIWSWRVWLCVFVLLGVISIKGPQKEQVLFWFGGLLLATLPNLEFPRANLLLVPVTFWGLIITTVLVSIWRLSRATAVRSLVIVMTLFALAVPAYGSLVFARDLRVNNLTVICYNAGLEYLPAATIPEARRKIVQDQLRAYGIHRKASLRTQFPKLVSDAVLGGRFGADQTNLPFVPRFNFLPTFPGAGPTDFCITSLR
jgi:hypothetical protein